MSQLWFVVVPHAPDCSQNQSVLCQSSQCNHSWFYSYAAICVQFGVCVVLISEKFEVCESSTTLQTIALLTTPEAETPSTVKVKFTCVLPIALAEETPVTERMELAETVGEPIALSEETPVTLIVTGTRAETVPMAVAAETPVTLTVIGRTTEAEPIALAAETPVTSTGTGLFHVPEFQVLLFQPVIKAIMRS